MPTNIGNIGPWFKVKPNLLRDKFNQHLKNSAFPERFPGIADSVKPPADRDFVIIRKGVTVKPENRDGLWAPCNLCGPKPKFIQEGYLICDNMGWLYLIGPKCGSDHYQDRFHDEERRFDREQLEIRAQEFLIDFAGNISKWLLTAEQLLEYAQEADAACERFRKSGEVYKLVRQAVKKHDGWLRIDEERKVLQVNGEYKTERYPLNITRLIGAEIVQDNVKMSKQLDRAISIMKPYGVDENCSLEFIFDPSNASKLPELAKELRAGVAMVQRAHRSIEQAKAFFSKENFKQIRSWAEHAKCPLSLIVEIRLNTRLICTRGARHRHPVKLEYLEKSLPILPS